MSEALEDQLALALLPIMAAWDNGETDNVGVARLILKLVRPAIEREAAAAYPDLARKAAAWDEWRERALALYWFSHMVAQGGPDGGDLDEAVAQDAEAAMVAIAAALEQGMGGRS